MRQLQGIYWVWLAGIFAAIVIAFIEFLSNKINVENLISF